MHSKDYISKQRVVTLIFAIHYRRCGARGPVQKIIAFLVDLSTQAIVGSVLSQTRVSFGVTCSDVV